MEDNSMKEAEESKINTLILTFGRTQANVLKFSEALMLMIDRCVFNQKFTIGKFCQVFDKAQGVKNKKPLDKDNLQGQRIIGREQLIFMFNEIAKILFKPDPHYQDKFYKLFLSEKIDVDDGEVNFSRVMSFDDVHKKILTEEFMLSMKQYQEEINNIFHAYLIENYFALKKGKRLLLSMREALLQNKKWTYTSIILFLKESETTPHLTTIQHIEENMRILVPNTNSKQQEFYNRHVILDTYQKQNESNEGTSHAGDPGLMLHEFYVFLARIAWDTYPRELQKKSGEEILERYFNYLFVRKNENIKTVALPNLSRKLINKMKDFYAFLEASASSNKGKDKKSESETQPVDILIEKINKDFFTPIQSSLETVEIFKALDRELPKMPPLPKVEPQCPPPYKKSDAFPIGMQPPPQPVEKNEKIKLQKKNDKKDEQPKRQFKWQNMPQVKTVAEDHLKGIQSKLTFEVQPLNDISRGTIKIESYPVIIGETLFLNELPKSVVPYLQEAIDALNNRNFVVALENYEKALRIWKKTQVQIESTTELFFEYSRGNIYLSAGKLESAFNAFFDCRRFAQTSRLPFSNPDRSLPYFGLGEVLFEMRQYELSARSFLKARQIRESVLSLEHVQTATVFNNLACCFFMLGRSHEALGYIQIAEVVLDTELGQHHQRTMVSRSNLKKIERGSFNNEPEYRRFWQVFEEDLYEKKKKKKKADDKKKK